MTSVLQCREIDIGHVTLSMQYQSSEDQEQVPLKINQVDRGLVKKYAAKFSGDQTACAIAMTAYREFNRRNREISYSRNPYYYDVPRRYHDPLYTHAKTTRGVDLLGKMGLVENHIAPVGRRGWQSWFRIEPRIVEMFESELPDFNLALPARAETIILKSRATEAREGRLSFADYRETKATSAMRAEVHAINAATGSVSIVDGQGLNVSASCRRIFVEDFDSFGRLYAGRDSWQNIKNRNGERQLITIDGEANYEVDFCSMAANMLRVEAGLPALADCYDLGDAWRKPHINPLTGKEVDLGRNLIKIAFQVVTNASGLQGGVLCIANLPEMMAFAPEVTNPERLSLAHRLVKDLKKRHADIASSFFTGVCARLQKADSDIAISTLKLCRKKGVVALPIHDSFLVQRSKVDILEQAMAEASAMHGFDGLLFKRS